MYNYKVDLSYDGSAFFGSQRQKHNQTVENTLHDFLSTRVKNFSKLTLSGRTDTGVHANSQIANFFSDSVIDPKSLLKNSKKYLKNISIQSIEAVDASFDARKSATRREYQYLFTEEKVPNYLEKYLAHVPFFIDEPSFKRCLKIIIGEHDFLLFKKTGSSTKGSIRTIYKAELSSFQYKVLTDREKTIKIYKLEIAGNAFLYRMVRNIVGCILRINDPSTLLTEEDFRQSFQERKRLFNFKPAVAEGLYLNKISY